MISGAFAESKIQQAAGETLMRSFLVILFVLAGASLLPGATVPYFEGFSSGGIGDPTPAEYTETTTLHWSLQPPAGGGEYQNLISVSGSAFSLVSLTSSSGVSFPTLPGTNFVMSTAFTIDAVTVTGADASRGYAGFGLLATDADYAATTSPRYQLLYVLDGFGSDVTGSLVLLSFNAPGSTVLASSASTLPVGTGLVYTLSVAGTYSGGGLTLTGNLSSIAGSISVSDTETGGVLTGTHFGFLDNVVATGAGSVSTLDIDYDYLTVVPEPSAVALMGTGLVALLLLRRKQLG